MKLQNSESIEIETFFDLTSLILCDFFYNLTHFQKFFENLIEYYKTDQCFSVCIQFWHDNGRNTRHQ